MTRRHRLLAALVALVAFTAYSAENALAVLCAPVPEAVAVGDGTSHGSHVTGHHAGHGPAASHGSHGSHPAAAAHAGHGDAASDHAAAAEEAPAPGSSHESHCPLGMSGPTCTGSTLPASEVVMLAAPAHAEAAFATSQVNIEYLLARTLYHPPRA